MNAVFLSCLVLVSTANWIVHALMLTVLTFPLNLNTSENRNVHDEAAATMYP